MERNLKNNILNIKQESVETPGNSETCFENSSSNVTTEQDHIILNGESNSLKVITNVCQNLQHLVESQREFSAATQRTQKVKHRAKKQEKKITLQKRREKNIEITKYKDTQATKAERTFLKQKIELVLVEEKINLKDNEADESINIKREVEDANKTIINNCTNALVESDPEESLNLLELMNCRKKQKRELLINPSKEKIDHINIFTWDNSNKIQNKNSADDLDENNSTNIESDYDNNKLNSSESEEADDLQEFLTAIEPKKSKYKPRQKPHLTEEQKAERERKNLERRTCTICNTVFAFPGGLRNHMRSKHTLEKPYSCEFCGEQFSIQSSYSLHKRRHLGIKPHLCNLCGKTFLRRMDMQIHMRIHIPSKDKVRDAKCSFCSNVYTSKINLRKHVLTKHTDPSEWKHKCNICGKKCFAATDLTLHVRQHNDDRKYKCVICGRGFFTKQSMNVHVRTHSASTAFNCHHCSNGYRSNEALQRHMLKVHGIGEEKPVSAPTHFCHICKEGFRQRARLEQHLIFHETGEEQYPFECKKCDKRYKARNYFTIHMMDKHDVFIDDAYFKAHFKSLNVKNCSNLDESVDIHHETSDHSQDIIKFRNINVEHDPS